LSSK
jgi:hypothetical protein